MRAERRHTVSFEPIETQEDLDRIISARLAREREKFADYDQLKAAAAEGAEAMAERDELRAELTEAHRASVAATAGLPVDLVVGDTREAMEAHAAAVAKVVAERTEAAAAATPPPTPPAPYVRGLGEEAAPENPLAALFGQQ